MPMPNNLKAALDNIIKKSRVHLYKPIQIAEILYHYRINGNLDLNDLESYRNISKRWRDDISMRLVGRKSTSSQKYQDNLFEANAISPNILAELGEFNKKHNGFIEKYIYEALYKRLLTVMEAEKDIRESTVENFSLTGLVNKFEHSPGLRRSIDKMYEILVYALFSTIVRALKATVCVEIRNVDKDITADFENFIKMVIGIEPNQTRIEVPASLFRVGVANAADRGLDMCSNFGPIVQVKHLTLTPQGVEDIALDIRAEKIVIACLASEKIAIEALLNQVGWSEKIQGIITLEDLNNWYEICLNKKYQDTLGKSLIKDISREFQAEFPGIVEIEPFLQERGYDKIKLPGDWLETP
jgi:hypothetical protein